MNLTERAEIRRETFYKLTNSAIAPEVPGGSRNLLRNSKSFTGSNITGSSKLLNENYNGYAVRYIKATEWAEIAQFSNCTVPKVNSIYTASFWAKGSGKIRAYFYGNPHYLEVLDGSSNQNGRTTAPDGAIDFTVTSEWKRYWVTYTLKSSFPSSDTTVAKHFLLRHLKSTSEEEFWVAGCKLEERNIADSCSQAPEDFGWTMDTITPTQSNRYLWKFDYIYYSDDSVEITPPVNLSLAGREEVYRETFYKLSEEGALGNLVVESKLSKGWLDANGKGQLLGPSANAEYTTDFIQVVAGRAYTFQWWSTISEGQKCWDAWQFYDKNKVPFGNRGGYGEYGSDGAQHGKRAIIAPENACYIRLSFRSFGNGHMMFEAGAGSESFEPSFDDSLKQGDRNLLAKTNQGKTNWAWSISSGGAVAGDEYIDGVNAVKLTRTSDDAVSWSYVQYRGLMRKLLEPNTEYTLSFDIYPSQNVTFTASLMRGDATGLLTNAVRMNQALANKWTKVSCVLTTKETLSDLTSQVIYLQGMPSAKGNYLIIKNIKLKKNTAPSNYTPAPEDYNWSNVSLTPTTNQRYLWKFEYIYYSDGSASTTDLVNLSVAGREETHRDVTFWHGLSATKHPAGIYDCPNRDHNYANEFNVVSGKKYTVRFIAQRTKGTINPKGGIWYTERTSGYQFDGLAPLTLVTDLSEDGLGVWERTLTVPDGKTKGIAYLQLDQSSTTGYSTAYRIYDALVFDENGNQLITTEVTNQPSTGALTTPMAAPDGTYIWKRTIRYFSDGATTTDWEYSGIGPKGADGIAGKDGVGVKSHLVTYGLSVSETTQPTSWSTQVPTLTKGNYLWTKTTWTYTDNTTETGYQKTYIAKDGNNGKDGIAGKDGVGIKSTAFFYVASTSGTTQPTTGWSTPISPVLPGNCLWTKTTCTYTDNTSESGYTVSKMGESQYTHIAYADNDKGGGFSQTDQTKAYIGMYVDFTATDSTDVTKYKWSKWHGDKGATGPQGIQGPKGADGRTPYLHIAYANSADGKTGFTTTNSNNKRYIGTLTDYTQADSTDPTKYKWVDMVGSVEVGGVNLLHNSEGPFQPNKSEPYKHDNYIVYPKVTAYLEEGKQYIVSAKTDGVFSNNHVNVESDNIILWMVKQNGSVNQIISDGKTGGAGTVFIWNHPSGEYCLRVNAYHDEPDKSAWEVKIEEGNIKTTYTRNPDDVQSEIDSKADQAITQQQLEALEAKRQQMIVEIEAKATLEQVSELTTFLNNLKKEDTDGRQKIIELTNAIEERVKSIEPIMDYSQKMQFIDTYITQGNGGMIIGANDSTTKVVVTPNRISFQDGGSEVAYISQSVLHIDNGVFTMSLQLGHFITRAHPKNQYVNATYFVK